MRIRSTKPEFWRSGRIASVDWEVIYDGPIPKRVNGIAPMSSTCEYVYLLFDGRDDLLYVGRSFRPADRFTKHRRKSWWSDVNGVVIIRVAELPMNLRRPRERVGPNTVLLEACAIAELHPRANVAAPARLALV